MRKTKHNQQGFSHILLILLVVVVLAGVGFIVYNRLQLNRTGLYQNGKDVKGVVASLKSDLLTKFPQYKDEDLGKSVYGTINYKANGYDFISYVSEPLEQTKFVFTYADQVSEPEATSLAESARNYFNSKLTSNDYKFKKDTSQQPFSGTHNEYYESDNSVCEAYYGFFTGASCVTKDAILKTSEAIKPFIPTLSQGEDVDLSKTAFGAPAVEDSKTPGYKIAYIDTGVMGGFSGVTLLYQKDGTWHYFTKSESRLLDCSAYTSNSDVRLAFLGKPCPTDRDNDSTVQ